MDPSRGPVLKLVRFEGSGYLGMIKTKLHMKCSRPWTPPEKNNLSSCFVSVSQFKSRFTSLFPLLSPSGDGLNESGQITIIPKPELRSFWGDSPTKPPFGVTSAEVVIICPDESPHLFQKPTGQKNPRFREGIFWSGVYPYLGRS